MYMYSRMHRICGVSIEDFLRKLYDFGVKCIAEYESRKNVFEKSFNFINSGNQEITEEDLIKCVDAEHKLRAIHNAIEEIQKCASTYSHTSEFKNLSKVIDLKSLTSVYTDAIAFHRSFGDLDEIFATFAFDFGFLADIIESLIDMGREDDYDDGYKTSAYIRWEDDNVGTCTSDHHLKFDELFHIDKAEFGKRCFEEYKSMLTFGEIYFYQFNLDVMLMARGKCIPKDEDALLKYYIAYEKCNMISVALHDLGDLICKAAISCDSIELKEFANYKMSDVSAYHIAYEYFSEILFTDKLNIGYIDKIKRAISENQYYSSAVGSLLSLFDTIHIVHEYFDAELEPTVYDEYYREYFYESEEAIEAKRNEARKKYEFMNQVCDFDKIPEDRFKDIFTLMDEMIGKFFR